MPMSHPATSSSGGNGAKWVKLRPVDSSAAAVGCMGFGLLGFGAVFAVAGAAAIVTRGSLGAGPFLLIGLVAIAYGGRKILAAVGPRPQLWADRLKAEAGDTINLRWATSSRFKQASFIRITWEGREGAITRAYNPIFHESLFVT